jgi:cysteine-rich repeat protein
MIRRLFSLAALTALILTVGVYISTRTPYQVVPEAQAQIPVNCGNGIPNAGEQCDDGNNDSGDACSPTCVFNTAECKIINFDSGTLAGIQSANGITISSGAGIVGMGATTIWTNAVAGGPASPANGLCGPSCNGTLTINLPPRVYFASFYSLSGTDAAALGTGGGATFRFADGTSLAINHPANRQFQYFSHKKTTSDIARVDFRATTTDAMDDFVFCQAPVAPPTCANGTKETGEQCDDGNTTNLDGCSASCQLEYCGDGVVQIGEACDDGNTNGNDACDATCEVLTCEWDILGQGMVEASSFICEYMDDWTQNFVNNLPGKNIRKNFMNLPAYRPVPPTHAAPLYTAVANEPMSSTLRGAFVFQPSTLYALTGGYTNTDTQRAVPQNVISKYVDEGKDLYFFSDGHGFYERYYAPGNVRFRIAGGSLQGTPFPQSDLNKYLGIEGLHGPVGCTLPTAAPGPCNGDIPPVGGVYTLRSTPDTPADLLALDGKSFANSTWGAFKVSTTPKDHIVGGVGKCIFEHHVGTTRYCVGVEYRVDSNPTDNKPPSRILLFSGISIMGQGVSGSTTVNLPGCSNIGADGNFTPGSPTADFLRIVTNGLCEPRVVCGNGTVETGEVCDDGNVVDGDGCSRFCQPTTVCNDGVDNDQDGTVDCNPQNPDPGCFPQDNMGGVCNPDDDSEENITCYSCTADLTDQQACDTGYYLGQSCPSGTSTNSNCSAQEPGGFCPMTQCSDGIDNGDPEDGLVDCTPGAEDPGCFPDGQGNSGVCEPEDDDETNVVSACASQCNSNYLGGGDIFCEAGSVCINNQCIASVCTISGVNCDPNQCLAICPSAVIANESSLRVGSTTNFTCTAVPGTARYVFRIKRPSGTIDEVQNTTNISPNYTITEHGQYKLQCQLCTGATPDTCLAFEPM